MKEKINRAFIENIRCMLSNPRLPKSVWVEVATITCFLIKHSPSVSIEKKILEKVWSANPSSYSDFKIFGYCTYAHVNNERLESKSRKCIFFSYKSSVK